MVEGRGGYGSGVCICDGTSVPSITIMINRTSGVCGSDGIRGSRGTDVSVVGRGSVIDGVDVGVGEDSGGSGDIRDFGGIGVNRRSGGTSRIRGGMHARDSTVVMFCTRN